jgi:hypothetical protein
MNVRRQAADDLAHLSLMGRLAERPQQANRDGVDPLAADQLLDGCLHVG